jgi:hypothetical protein
LLKSIHDEHDDLNKTVNTIRSIRTQATEWAKRVKGTPGETEVVDSAKALCAKLDEVEGELLQVKIQSEQDSLNYPVKLNSKLAALAFLVGGSEFAPTAQAKQLYGELAKQVDAQIEHFHGLLSSDVPAFNKTVADSGTGAVVLEPAN